MSAPRQGDAVGAPSPSQPLRVVLADDHQLIRRGLQLILEAEDGIEVVAQAGDLSSARECVRKYQPDVLVLDINMPGGSSLPAIPELRAIAPSTQIVVLTMQEDPAFVRDAWQAGALGYVFKGEADGDLVAAVRQAAAGRPYLNRRLATRLVVERTRSALSD